MAALESYIYLRNQLLLRINPSVVLTAVASAGAGTNDGYSVEAVSAPNWATPWKAPDSAVNDYYIAIDGGSTGWLGFPQQIFFIMAYDARGSNQDTITLVSDTTDNPAGTFTQTKRTMTLIKTAPCIAAGSFFVSSPGKRYYRLNLLAANRSGGSVMPKIFHLGVYRVATDVFRINTDFAPNTTSPGKLSGFGRNGVVQATSMEVYTNRHGRPGQTVEMSFQPSDEPLWTTVRDALWDLNVNGEAFFVQFEGLINADTAGTCMVRMNGDTFEAQRDNPGLYSTIVSLDTEATPL